MNKRIPVGWYLVIFVFILLISHLKATEQNETLGDLSAAQKQEVVSRW